MKKITKNLGTVTKVLMIALLMTGVTVDSFAQKKEKKKKKEKAAKELKRPGKVGNAGVDTYVSSAFNVYEKNQAVAKKLSDAAGNAGEMKAIKADLEGQMKEVTGLLGKSADAVKGAKSITPKTDSMKAVKACTAGTKALNATKEAIPGQLEMIKTQGAKK